MKVTQEKLPASQIGLEIEISAETSQKTYEKVVQNLARTANIPGFRKGKVPRQILLQRLGMERIKATALEELIQNSLKEAVEQESIDSLGNYQLRSNFDELLQNYQPGQALVFSASIDVPPTVTLGDYQSLSVKAEETLYDEKQLEEFLEERRKEQSTLVPVENRPAQMGDIAVVDYRGRFADVPVDGEAIPGTEATDFQMELADGRFVKGMVEGVVGMNPSETKEVTVTFPEDYPHQDLASKEVIFTISLKEIKEKELPELDDDLAQEISEFETIAELKESLESQFKEKAEKATKSAIHEAILEQLVQNSAVDLPETLIEKEVNNLLTQTAMQMQNYGMDLKRLFTPEMVSQMRQRSRPDAITNLQKSLILDEIAKKESVEVDSETYEAKVKEVQEQLADRDIDVERLRAMIKDDLLKEATLDWLQTKTTVELVPQGSLTKTEEEEEEEEETEASEMTVEAETSES